MSWYAVRIAPQREFALAGRFDAGGAWVPGILQKRGYTTFLPVETKLRRAHGRARKRTPVTYPLFTGYLFVREPECFLRLRSENDHILGVVRFDDGRPAPITDAEIDRLRKMSGEIIPHSKSVNPHRALRTGELAEIKSGPFQGHIVRIEGLHGRKARIFMNLFGFRKLAEIELEKLEAA